MKLGFLSLDYPHPKVSQSAGIGTSIKNLVHELKHHNEQIHVFVYNQKTDEVFDDNGVTVHMIAYKHHNIFSFYFQRMRIKKYLEKVIAEEKIDLIEAPDWTGILAFINLSLPVVIRFHGTDAYFCNIEKRPNKLKNFLFEKWGLQKADAYIAPTRFAATLTAQIFELDSSKIKVIYYGLDLENFINTDSQSYERFTLLYAGALIRKKGVMELPGIFQKVLKSFPNARLLLIGGDTADLLTSSDSTWALIQNDLEKLGVGNVSFLGRLPYSEVKNHIQNAHVCVFPTFAETLGMVTIEAMAMKKPVVSSDKGWVGEIIENNVSGIMIDPKNHQEFADAIISLFENPEKCFQMGIDAHQRVSEKFDIKKLAIENLEYYQRVIDQKR